ncbi:ABC transporter permease [Actinoplanes aureus]|uniref:Transport permease protein n=1 Tax=Actinoplanes aureus TaxID=2792083 RepID=A0A931CG46_9ACTN|nr:ABC transporter permease [Actinoplanes aureus]MBG0564280.1 ABC transporter permease [Actinoplanes aureus]
MSSLVIVETRLSIREKVGPIWGVAFPLILLIILGNVPFMRETVESAGGLTVFEIYVPIIIMFNVAMLALIALPNTLAGYRENGVLRRLQTTPAGPARVLAAQLVANLAIAVVAVVLFLAVAWTVFGARLPDNVAGFTAAWLLVTAALLSIGLLITALAPGRGLATSIGTVLYFPMMFLAGLWVPISEMPPVLREISHASPLGAGARAFQDAYEGGFPGWQPVLILLAYAVVCSAASIRWFRWE